MGLEASDQSEDPQSVCEARALQDGGHPPSPRSPSTWGLGDKDGPKGCLPAGSNPFKPPNTSNISLGREILQVHLPTIRPDISTESFHMKIMKPVVRFLRQVGCHLVIYLDDLLIVHQNKVQLQQIIQLICQLFECLGLIVNICFTTNSKVGISGL